MSSFIKNTNILDYSVEFLQLLLWELLTFMVHKNFNYIQQLLSFWDA